MTASPSKGDRESGFEVAEAGRRSAFPAAVALKDSSSQRTPPGVGPVNGTA
jgi:hypothetical protein